MDEARYGPFNGGIVRITLNQLPPSVNDAYTHFRGRLIHTALARAFLARVSTLCSEAVLGLASRGVDLPRVFDPDVPVVCLYDFYVTKLENATWVPEAERTEKTKSAKTRFARIDVSNMVKLLEDSVLAGLGIDDSRVLRSQLEKKLASEPRTVITLWPKE